MKLKIDKIFILISVLTGLFLGAVLEMLYRAEGPFSENRILAIMAYLVIFVIAVGVVLVIKGFQTDAYAKFSKVILLTLAVTVGFTGFTALFEFLYEINAKTVEFTSTSIQYAFLVDDSSSMLDNDSENERYDAVEKIINNLDNTKDFAVYRFADIYNCDTKMGSESSRSYEFEHSGKNVGTMTNILATVRNVADETGNASKHTKIIVLTDGEPTDDGYMKRNETINYCLANNCSISSVGFGYANEAFMTELADKTGGTYVFSSDLDDLMDDLEEIVKAKISLPTSKRDMLGARELYKPFDVLHCILRILFLSILGAVWTVIKMLLVGEKKFTKKATVTSIILCSAVAVLVEVLTIVPIDAVWTFARVVFCGLWALTMVPKATAEKINSGNGELNSVMDLSSKNEKPNDLNKGYKEVGGPKSFL